MCRKSVGHHVMPLIADVMCRTRDEYHIAVSKATPGDIQKGIMTNDISSNRGRDFWKAVQRVFKIYYGYIIGCGGVATLQIDLEKLIVTCRYT